MQAERARRYAINLAWVVAAVAAFLAGTQSFTWVGSNRSPRAAVAALHREAKALAARELTGTVMNEVAVFGGGSAYPIQSPVAVAVAGRRRVMILDNNPGAVFEATLGDGGSATFRESMPGRRFVYPFAMHATARHLYVADSEGLHIVDPADASHTTVRWFYTAHDLLPLDRGRVLVNAAPPQRHYAWVTEVQDGVKRREWMPDGNGSTRHESGWKAQFADCGPLVAVSPAHEPRVYLLNTDTFASNSWDIPFPRRERLLAMLGRPELTNPEPGVYQLPGFSSGVACAGGAVFILLDLPRLAIYRFGLDGSRPEMLLFPRTVEGRFWRLAAEPEGERVRLYTLEKQTGGISRLVVVTVDSNARAGVAPTEQSTGNAGNSRTTSPNSENRTANKNQEPGTRNQELQ